jgi:hypothetical protein
MFAAIVVIASPTSALARLRNGLFAPIRGAHAYG